MSQKNTYEFKAEVQQLLNILVHSLYSNKEIFVRELVSNGSDALDKLRFEQQAGAEINDLPLEIRITADKDAGILRITDTGVGMTEEELQQNVGTIAHSGTAKFMEQIAKSKDNKSVDSIIGQFGVGFYSVFMVADKVRMTTRSWREGSRTLVWTSDGLGTYEIEPADEELERGTVIEVFLKEDERDYADETRLKSIINRHSNFVSFPIYVGEEEVNTIPALWREPKFNIKKEQYDEFYKFLTFDQDEPLDTLHTSADAPIQFSSILFVPKTNHDYMGDFREAYGLDLYVRRVLIQHRNTDILPEYLGFLRGVVDSEDLPLNISRETLQENVLLRKISSTLTKHVLTHLGKLRDSDREKYEQFWREWHRTFKLGYSDFMNKDAFADLLLFNSSVFEDEKGLMTLKEYAAKVKPEQPETEGEEEKNDDAEKPVIYFVFGQSRSAIESNPHLEIFRRKGIEVLYLYEPIDEFIMDTLREYDGCTLTSVETADLSKLDSVEDKDDADKPEELNEKDEKSFTDLLASIKEILGDKVSDVIASKRLQDSPVVLANADGSMSSTMQKFMKLMQKDDSVPVKILEVNKNHPLIRNLLDIFKKNSADEYIKLAAEHLYESALLLEGYLTDPHGLVKRIQDHLTKSSGWYKKN